MGDQRLPPGQVLTRKFPVVGERMPAPEALDLGTWRLEIGGRVETPLAFSWSDYQKLPQREQVADIHCVTGWSRFGSRFTGQPLAELLARARPLPAARFVRFEAYSPRFHDTSLPLDVALEDTWLVHAVDGVPLTLEHGFPLRTVTPSRYFYKSIKWLRRIELLTEDRRGYWERESSYHDVGDPWAGNQRFSTGSIDPAELARFLAAGSYGLWRGPRKVLLGLDLRGFRPTSRDLSRLQLKSCDLRDAELASCDLTGANLSLSDLREANLAGATLVGADLEGTDFSGANLSGADLSRTQLSATRFFTEREDGSRLEARVERIRLEGATGLLETQEAFLRARGALESNQRQR